MNHSKFKLIRRNSSRGERGDYLIRDGKDDVWVIGQDIYKKTYEEFEKSYQYQREGYDSGKS